MQTLIRAESPRDFLQIKTVNDLAFGQDNEGKIVDSLRGSEDYISVLSLVAELNREVIGHILFYPISIVSNGGRQTSLSLGPMSVLPEHQSQGVGSQLVTAGLEVAPSLGFDSVVVLGHPDYYSRFGFKPASGFGIKAPFDVPDEAFMATELVLGGLEEAAGTVEYPRELDTP